MADFKHAPGRDALHRQAFMRERALHDEVTSLREEHEEGSEDGCVAAEGRQRNDRSATFDFSKCSHIVFDADVMREEDLVGLLENRPGLWTVMQFTLCHM